MWMGGVPPLGYRVEDRELVIIDSEAEIVRSILCRYVELGSVRLLKEECEARGIKSKSWTSASGRCVGGKPFSRGALDLILQNRTYLGEIVHKEQSHPGGHTPIIDQPLWDAVQAQLASNSTERSSGNRARQPSLLAGLLFGADGNAMTPTHAVKNGMRYRYYVSRPPIAKDRTKSSTGLRIPAAEIEHLVASRLRDGFSIPAASTRRHGFPIHPRSVGWLCAPRRSARAGPSLPAGRQRAFLTTLIERIDVGADRIDIHFRPTRLGTFLDVAATRLPSAVDDETQVLSVPVRLRRCGREITMLIDGADPSAAAKPDARLIRLLIRARRFNAALIGSDGVPFAALAKQEGVSPSYFTRLVRLSYLAPDMTQAILDGHQPRGLTADKLTGALTSTAGVARAAHRARLCLSRSETQRSTEIVNPRRPASLATSPGNLANRIQ
jgi:site-specific DNA recombinase